MCGHDIQQQQQQQRTLAAELCLICEIFIHFYGFFSFSFEGGRIKSQTDEEKWNLKLAWFRSTAGWLVTLREMICAQEG